MRWHLGLIGGAIIAVAFGAFLWASIDDAGGLANTKTKGATHVYEVVPIVVDIVTQSKMPMNMVDGSFIYIQYPVKSFADRYGLKNVGDLENVSIEILMRLVPTKTNDPNSEHNGQPRD